MHHCSLSEQKTLLKVDWCENCMLLGAQCQSLNTQVPEVSWKSWQNKFISMAKVNSFCFPHKSFWPGGDIVLCISFFVFPELSSGSDGSPWLVSLHAVRPMTNSKNWRLYLGTLGATTWLGTYEMAARQPWLECTVCIQLTLNFFPGLIFLGDGQLWDE